MFVSIPENTAAALKQELYGVATKFNILYQKK